MTYSEWIAKLKEYLANVSEEERKRVLDYYSEVYADRKENGDSEESIIVDFGAPYDAAVKILGDDQLEKAVVPSTANVPAVAPTGNVQQSSGNGNGFVRFLLGLLQVVTILALSVLTVCLFFADISAMLGGCAEFVSAMARFVDAEPALGLLSLGLALVYIGLGVAALPWISFAVRWLWKNQKQAFAELKKR